MLMMPRSLVVCMIGLIMIFAPAWTGSLISPAGATECEISGYGGQGSGGGAYGNACPGDGSDDTSITPIGGGGQGAAPSCDLAGVGTDIYSNQNRTPNFCKGKDVCFNTDALDLTEPPSGRPEKEGGKIRVTWCYTGSTGAPNVVLIFWSDEEEPPSRLEQAREAIGNINIGMPGLQISPDGRTLVNLDTWYWLDGAEQEVTGSSAFGLVAIASFRSVNVDPGDGTGSFTCPLVTTAAAAEKACAHEYRRASTRGGTTVDGRAAYAASATTVYDLTFEVDGNPVEVDGAPASLDGPAAETAVRVDEVQSQVTQLG